MITATMPCVTDESHDDESWECEFENRASDTRNTRSATNSSRVVEQFIQALKETAKVAIVVGKLPALRAVATELFDDVTELEVVHDPEIPGARYVTMTVQARGDVRAIANLRREWYRKIHGMLGSSYNLLHLAIDIVE